MAERALVSVVVPTYQRANSLRRAIESVLAQSHANFELIVVDDGSSDHTDEVVRAFDDSRLHYVVNDRNLGVSRARNRGVELARGEWVALLDSDDEALPQRLERQLAAAQSPAVALVLCGDVVVNAPAMSFTGFKSTEPVLDVSSEVAVRIPGASCWLVRRSAFLVTGGFDPVLNCFEDWELAMRLSEYGSVLMVNEPLVRRAKSPGSLYSDEAGHARNLKFILARHGERIARNPKVWAFYCSFIGQCECQYGSLTEGRRWFLRGLRAYPAAPRAWLNFVLSLFGRAAFSRWVSLGRRLRMRLAPAVRPALSQE